MTNGRLFHLQQGCHLMQYTFFQYLLCVLHMEYTQKYILNILEYLIIQILIE
jgi:hypothetical protein